MLITSEPYSQQLGHGKGGSDKGIEKEEGGRKRMLRFLSKVKLQYNALDARAGTCKDFLAQCISKDSNSSCQVQLKHRTDDHPPQINVTFINGVEEVFDASITSAQTIRSLILQKGRYLETEQMFRDAGEAWPVIIPFEELRLPAPGIKPRKAEEKK